MKIKVFAYLISLLSLFLSCQTQQEKTIQTELDKIEGQWKINSFAVEGQKAGEWKNLLKSGEILFKSCRSKNVKHSNTYCEGDFQINTGVYKISYRFDSNFIFKVRAISKDGSGIIKMTDEETRVTTLLSGNWDIVVNDTILVARQLSNNPYTGALTSFSATRK